jgi:hypothetical protein
MTTDEYYDESSTTKTETKLSVERETSMASENRNTQFLALQRRAVWKIDLIVS